MKTMVLEAPVQKVEVSAYTIPTDAPEGDGTLKWDSTTLILCEIHAGNRLGIGYTCGDKATATLSHELARKCLIGQPALDIPSLHESMLGHVRNDGSRGIASMAISALDVALWDLKARLFDCKELRISNLGPLRPLAPHAPWMCSDRLP